MSPTPIGSWATLITPVQTFSATLLNDIWTRLLPYRLLIIPYIILMVKIPIYLIGNYLGQ